ncbi:hypothetical protein CAC42_7309 [Sphaceloma murrayae]|uniref:Uncharacterized protein n=1 Tax=Sphaceloma murrayae TaxID=2082308 RepID=A0A2K1QWN6_9PEZI|nr:hypothetical protein CAC42_7309 [Sphaceloma murrayae]
MDFFGDYSIETASCHPSSLTAHEDDVFAPSTFPPPSPMSSRGAGTSNPSSYVNVTNLSRVFSLQTLDTPTMDSDINSHLSHDYSAPSPTHLQVPSSPLRRTSISSSRTAPCWKRRMQRQRDIRLLSDESHLKSIAELVERMVDSSDQCGVITRRDADLTPTPATPVFDDGEDYFDSSDSGSPRSLSSSSGGRRPSYFNADFVSPTQRRTAEAGSLSMTFHNSKVQKTRARRGARR